MRDGVTLLGRTTACKPAVRLVTPPEYRVIALTPRWTCHDMITCAGVMPSLQAMAFTWEYAD